MPHRHRGTTARAARAWLWLLPAAVLLHTTLIAPVAAQEQQQQQGNAQGSGGGGGGAGHHGHAGHGRTIPMCSRVLEKMDDQLVAMLRDQVQVRAGGNA